MAEPVATLLERGLRHYALGEIERAVACWREALERDPSSARAREYLTLVRASVPGAVALPSSSRRTPGPVRSPGPRGATPGKARAMPVRDVTPAPRNVVVTSPRAPEPSGPPERARAPARSSAAPAATEELEMAPGPVWAPPLEGLWADAVPPGPGDTASAGPAPIPAEVEISLEMTPGPGGDAIPIEVSPGPGLSPPQTPGPSRVVIGVPLSPDSPGRQAAGSSAAVAPASPPRVSLESSEGPFGTPEAFDLGTSGRRRAPSGWDDGNVAVVEVATEGSDALGLVNGQERSPPVAAPPSRTPVPPSPSNVADTLMRGARELFDLGDFSGSLELVQKALDADPVHREARSYLERNQGTLIQMYESKLGLLNARPRVMLKPDEIVWLSLDHRAGFVLAQIDGTVTYDDIFSVSSLPHLDTAKILAELLEQGVISA